jgi:hypothetical protein
MSVTFATSSVTLKLVPGVMAVFMICLGLISRVGVSAYVFGIVSVAVIIRIIVEIV